MPTQHIIANSTGATLVHLAKTLLVPLVENGKREISQVATGDDHERGDNSADADSDASAAPSLSEVDALVKIFDLRHQILSSQAHFQRTSSELAKRTEKHLRAAETELMALEEARAVEARAVNTIVDIIDQYDSELQTCKHKIELNHVLLASIAHRRTYIRSTNVSSVFVPAYRLTTKQMTSSSDQLLYTVLLDKLQSIAKTINEWATMEAHFHKMTASLHETLVSLGTKRSRDGTARVSLPSTPALFARVKIPLSRRLIGRQLANYAVNADTIKTNRASMRKTLAGVLKIAREEHLSAEIIDLTALLYRKCRSMKGDDTDDVEDDGGDEAVEEKSAIATSVQATADDDAKSSSDGNERASDEPAAKKQRIDEAVSAGGEPHESDASQDAGGAALGAGAGDAAVEDVESKRNHTTEGDAGASSMYAKSGMEEIPLSEASATLADLAPDDESAVDSVAKYPSRSILLNLDEPPLSPAPDESDARMDDESESYVHRSVDSARGASVEHSNASGGDFSSARLSHEPPLLDVPSRGDAAVLPPSYASQSQAEADFASGGEGDGDGTFELEQQDAAKASLPFQSQLLVEHGFAQSPLFGQSKAAKPSTDTPSDSELLLQQQQQQQRAEMEMERQRQQQLRVEQERQLHLQQQRAEQERQLQLQQQQLRVEQERQQQLRAEQERQQQLRVEQERQREEEQQVLLNQALEVLKQHPPKPVGGSQPLPVVAQPTAPSALLKQLKQPTQPKQTKQTKHQQQQQQQQLHQQQHEHHHQLQAQQLQFQRPPSHAISLSRGAKDASLLSPAQPPAAPVVPQLHHAAHLQQMLTHAHQQQQQQQQHMPLHLPHQHQQQQHHQPQPHVAQSQRQLQHPLYGDVSKGISMSGLGGAQDHLYVDHTQQQTHLGMDLQQQQQQQQQQHHHLHQSHLASADVLRSHDLATGHSGVSTHFGGASATAGSLRASAFLQSTDGRGSQQQQQQHQHQHQRAYYSDDNPHGHQVLHSHDVFSSPLGGHHPQQQQQQQHHHHQHLFTADLHQPQQAQQQQQQQQQHSRSILTDQEYQSHLLARHYRDQDNMDPSGADDVNMGQWN